MNMQENHFAVSGHTRAEDGHCVECRALMEKGGRVVDAKGRVTPVEMTAHEMLVELTTTIRAIADALESFDPSSLLAGLGLGGSGGNNAMGAILGSLVRP